MRPVIVLILALLLTPGVSAAQMHGRGQHMMGGQGMSQCGMENRDMMNQMMDEVHQMMGQSHWTDQQQEQMQDVMNQMGQMRQQMAGSQNPQVEQRQRKQLQEMRHRLDNLKMQGELQR